MKPGNLVRRLASCGSIGLATALLAFAGASSLPTPAQAQFGGRSPLETDKNVVVPELSRMIPSAGVRTNRIYQGGFSWKTVHTLSLFAVTSKGLSTRNWKSDVGAWTAWTHLGNPSGVPLARISGSGDDPGMDFGLPLLQGWGQGFPEWIAYQGLAKPAGGNAQWPIYSTATMNVDSPLAVLDHSESAPNFKTLTSATHPSTFNHFDPQAGFMSVLPSGQNQFMRHMFGTSLPRGYMDSASFSGATIPLIELQQQTAAGTPTWIDHGTPADHTGVVVGPSSSADIIHNWSDPDARTPQRYVFVATDPFEAGGGDGLNGRDIAALRYDESGSSQATRYSWEDLGAPAGFVYGAPVAIPYYTGTPASGGLGKIRLHVVAETGSRDFEIFSRIHDGQGWGAGWRREGAPPELNGERFKMTSAVVWYDGPKSNIANMRMHNFGYSEEANGNKGGLVEFRWNGSSWGFRPVRYAPNGESLRTTHAIVSDLSKEDRISVIVRTTSGRIYEYFKEFDHGTLVKEGWEDLSYESLLKPSPTIPFLKLK